MAIWMVSYDLRAPGRNYEPLYKALKAVPYARPLESVWFIEAAGPSSRIRDILLPLLDRNDGLIVMELTESADWAVWGINTPSKDWIIAKRP